MGRGRTGPYSHFSRRKIINRPGECERKTLFTRARVLYAIRIYYFICTIIIIHIRATHTYKHGILLYVILFTPSFFFIFPRLNLAVYSVRYLSRCVCVCVSRCVCAHVCVCVHVYTSIHTVVVLKMFKSLVKFS